MRVRPRSRLQMHSGNDLHRWTISFADFMTLMFAVFVVLYAIALSKEEKYKDAIQSIQNASKLLKPSVLRSHREGILDKNSNNLIEDARPAIFSEEMSVQADEELSSVGTLTEGWDLNQLKIDLETLFLSELDNELIRLNLDGEWLTLEVGGQLLFAGGSHTLLLASNELVGKLADTLAPISNMLRIRGYTDQKKISNEIYSSNWELSAARAFSVLHALIKRGIVGQRMAVEAYGQYSPVIDENGYVDNLNSRRVVIAISKYALVERIVASPKKMGKKSNQQAQLVIKADTEKMHELHLPNNRLIITTRQK